MSPQETVRRKLNSALMRRFLRRGLRHRSGRPAPADGYLDSLYHKASGIENGWHVQVERVYDLRFWPRPKVTCYAWSPSGKAYYLSESDLAR